MIRTFVVEFRRPSELTWAGLVNEWEHTSRDVALARVTAILCTSPHARVVETTMEIADERWREETRFVITV